MKIKHVTKGKVEIPLRNYQLLGGVPVLYVGGSSRNPEGEFGIISSVNASGNIFVRFEENIRVLGFEETTGKSCRPEDLILLS